MSAIPAAVLPEDPAATRANSVSTTTAPANKWERAGLAVLLAGTAVAYLCNITVNAMGNAFYAAAVQAGTKSWKALLFGSLDSANFITVDKPPMSQWVMGLSGRIFGFGSASMLIPQALMAVAAVALLYSAITRATHSRGAGLLAGAALAATPVAALMFRYNNPDAVMVLLMTAAAYCTIRALPRADSRWLALAGSALGFAFLAKMLEGLMVLPALAITYLVVAPTTLRARLLHLVGAAVALIISCGWYVVLTIAWPASSRPYLAGSTNNTFLNLVFGYNGFAKFRTRHRAVFGGFDLPQHTQRLAAWGSEPGPTRLFTNEIGFEISWLLPAALVAFVIVLRSRGRAPRTDLTRAAALIFGLWLIIEGAAFTTMKGGMAAYYTLSIAPAVVAMFALGVHEVWRRRGDTFGRIGAAALIAAAGVWSFVVLQRNSDWLPWLRWVILVVSVVAALALVTQSVPGLAAKTLPRRAVSILIVVGVLAGLGGSTAYALTTLPQKHSGGGPTTGPNQRSGGTASSRPRGWFVGAGPNPGLDAMLRHTTTRWSAAVDRSSVAASLELSTGTAVMAIGGFTGTDPVPTLDQFRSYVRERRVAYYLVEQQEGRRLPTTHADLTAWVADHFTPIRVGSAVVYNLLDHRHPA